MTQDWHDWYTAYDDPASSLSRRLQVVRDQLSSILRAPAGDSVGPARLISMCSGDGRDTLPVLAEVAPTTRALLLELDETLAETARRSARALGLRGVDVVTTDAGMAESYADAGPADVVLACGVFGNISDADVARTVASLPSFLAPHGVVIWTRGHPSHDDPTEQAGDPGEWVREQFAAAGFEELAFVRPDDASFRVGVHRYVGPPIPVLATGRLFSFV